MKFSEVVLLDGFAVTPGGKVPDVAHTYGVHPPLALTTAQWAVPTIPLGTVVVLMPTDEAKQLVVISSRSREKGRIPSCCRGRMFHRPASLQTSEDSEVLG